jgi:hypothetical protein
MKLEYKALTIVELELVELRKSWGLWFNDSLAGGHNILEEKIVIVLSLLVFTFGQCNVVYIQALTTFLVTLLVILSLGEKKSTNM